jgi:hypothetical protein
MATIKNVGPSPQHSNQKQKKYWRTPARRDEQGQSQRPYEHGVMCGVMCSNHAGTNPALQSALSVGYIMTGAAFLIVPSGGGWAKRGDTHIRNLPEICMGSLLGGVVRTSHTYRCAAQRRVSCGGSVGPNTQHTREVQTACKCCASPGVK